MVDYSKWDALSDSDDEEPGTNGSLIRKQTEMPYELAHHLQKLSVEDPSALDKLDQEIESAKASAHAQARRGLGSSVANYGDADRHEQSKPLAEQGQVMRDKIEAIDKQRKDMDNQMRRLEQLASSGDEASVLKFFEDQGMKRGEIQRMIGGSQTDTEEVLSMAAEKATADATPELTAKSEVALGLLDSLQVIVAKESKRKKSIKGLNPRDVHMCWLWHLVLFLLVLSLRVVFTHTHQKAVLKDDGVPPPADSATADKQGGFAGAGKGPSSPAPSVRTVIPELRQRVVSTASSGGRGNTGGKSRRSVVMEISLPLLTKASDAQLDIAPRVLKLRASPPLATPPLATPPGATTAALSAAPSPCSASRSGAGTTADLATSATAAVVTTLMVTECIEYLLSTELVETVDPSKASAKWNKKTKCLSVTLPLARS